MHQATRFYRSIFLADGWAHQKYFGWHVVAEQPGLRILQKRRSVFHRYLVLLTAGGEIWLNDAIRNGPSRGGLSDILVHDFDGRYAESSSRPPSGFRSAESGERLLNIATFAVDLEQNEREILGSMTSDYRRKIKKACSVGIEIEAHPRPKRELRENFVSTFAAFAAERGLQAPDSRTLDAMYAAGDAILFIARKKDGISNYLHVYTTNKIGYYMYGVNLCKENDGAGQYLHWEIMRYLKSAGVGWYDFGGVARIDRSDGIYNFKEKFGGSLVLLGTEWRRTGRVMKYGASAKIAIARWRRRL